MREPLFTETLQIAIVVRDLEATMRTYVEEYGIGPWEVYEFHPDDSCAARRGRAADERGVATGGDDGRERAVGARSSRSTSGASTRSSSPRRGRTPSRRRRRHRLPRDDGHDAREGAERAPRRQSTTGVTFAYLSTDEDLKVMTEIFDWPEGLVQEPDAVYPA